jgi:NAD(P)-dependent dehydrogenase (short-subunit alcohol dehydrogenase family)
LVPAREGYAVDANLSSDLERFFETVGSFDHFVYTAGDKRERNAMFNDLGQQLPMGRVAEADDVAKAFVYLMDSDYVTGTVSVVDGGALATR